MSRRIVGTPFASRTLSGAAGAAIAGGASPAYSGAMFLLASLLGAAQPAQTASGPAAPPEAVVQAFVAAYNGRDFAALEAALAADAKWYSVDGDKIAVEGEGAPALMAWLRRYLGTGCPTCRSSLTGVAPSGAYVATVEQARWVRDGICLAQSSPAVYHVAEGRIRAVWYFPASPRRPCTEAPAEGAAP